MTHEEFKAWLRGEHVENLPAFESQPEKDPEAETLPEIKRSFYEMLQERVVARSAELHIERMSTKFHKDDLYKGVDLSKSGDYSAAERLILESMETKPVGYSVSSKAFVESKEDRRYIVSSGHMDAALMFGKFKGKRISDLYKTTSGINYLKWILISPFPEELKIIIRKYEGTRP